VFTNTITNYASTPARRFEYTIGIRYSDDATKAIALIDELIEDHTYILKNPGHQAFVDNLGDNSVNIIVKLWSPASVWYSVKLEFLKEIKTTLESNGIEFAFPQRTVWLANELNGKTIAI
jgi:small-conductance mechanosensitive channel